MTIQSISADTQLFKCVVILIDYDKGFIYLKKLYHHRGRIGWPKDVTLSLERGDSNEAERSLRRTGIMRSKDIEHSTDLVCLKFLLSTNCFTLSKPLKKEKIC